MKSNTLIRPSEFISPRIKSVSAVSFCSMFTASANAGRETFRIYVDVPINSGVSDVCLNLRYDPDVTDVCRFYKGMLNNSYSCLLYTSDAADE